MIKEKIIHVKILSNNDKEYIFMGSDISAVESLINYNVNEVGLAIKSKQQIDADQAAGLFRERRLETYLATIESMSKFKNHARRMCIND